MSRPRQGTSITTDAGVANKGPDSSPILRPVTAADLADHHIDFVLSMDRSYKSFETLYSTMDLARKQSPDRAADLDVYMKERSFLTPFVRGTYEFMSKNVPRDAIVFYFGRLCEKTRRRLSGQSEALQNALLFPDVPLPCHPDPTEFRRVPSMIFSVHCRGLYEYWLKVPGEFAQPPEGMPRVVVVQTKSETDATEYEPEPTDCDTNGYVWYRLGISTIVVNLKVFGGRVVAQNNPNVQDRICFTTTKWGLIGEKATNITPNSCDTLLLKKGKPYRRMVALCVGVNEFCKEASSDNLQPLACAEQDVKAMKSAFAKVGFDYVESLCGESATADHIVRKMETLADEHFEDSPESNADIGGLARNLFVFYFSGHGLTVTTHDGPQVVLCAYDFERRNGERLMPRGVISRDMLSDVLTRIDARHVLFIFDCCHAGGLLVSKGGNDNDGETVGPDDRLLRGRAAELLRRALSTRAVRVMAGSAATEAAMHVNDQDCSVFTNALLRAMCCSEHCGNGRHDAGCAFSATAPLPMPFLCDEDILRQASANIELVGGQHPVMHSPLVFGGAEDRLHGRIVLPHHASVPEEAKGALVEENRLDAAIIEDGKVGHDPWPWPVCNNSHMTPPQVPPPRYADTRSNDSPPQKRARRKGP